MGVVQERICRRGVPMPQACNCLYSLPKYLLQSSKNCNQQGYLITTKVSGIIEYYFKLLFGFTLQSTFPYPRKKQI